MKIVCFVYRYCLLLLNVKMSLESIRYLDGKLEILDQLLLPTETKYIPIKNVEEGWDAIRLMKVNRLM